MQWKASAIFAAWVLGGACPEAIAKSAVIPDPGAPHHLGVSIDEIGKTFVSRHPFSGSYAAVVTMSNGSRRTIRLTPMMRDGMLVVRFDDDGGHSYMGPNGTTTNGTPARGMLMVQLRNLDYPPSAWKWIAPMKAVPANGVEPDPATTRFVVSIHEVRKNDVFARLFARRYSTTVTTADGAQHRLELVSTSRNGKWAVKYEDNGRVSWLDPDASLKDGKLLIQVRDMTPVVALMERWSGAAR